MIWSFGLGQFLLLDIMAQEAPACRSVMFTSFYGVYYAEPAFVEIFYIVTSHGKM